MLFVEKMSHSGLKLNYFSMFLCDLLPTVYFYFFICLILQRVDSHITSRYCKVISEISQGRSSPVNPTTAYCILLKFSNIRLFSSSASVLYSFSPC